MRQRLYIDVTNPQGEFLTCPEGVIIDISFDQIVKCEMCEGNGWYADHDHSPHSHSEDGSCNGSCPIQVQCENCRATGKYFSSEIIIDQWQVVEGKEKSERKILQPDWIDEKRLKQEITTFKKNEQLEKEKIERLK